jgi:hypothetical protein
MKFNIVVTNNIDQLWQSHIALVVCSTLHYTKMIYLVLDHTINHFGITEKQIDCFIRL